MVNYIHRWNPGLIFACSPCSALWRPTDQIDARLALQVLMSMTPWTSVFFLCYSHLGWRYVVNQLDIQAFTTLVGDIGSHIFFYSLHLLRNPLGVLGNIRSRPPSFRILSTTKLNSVCCWGNSIEVTTKHPTYLMVVCI